MARNAIREVTLLLAFLFCPQSVRCEPAFQPDVKQEAKVILAAAGVGSGLVVHVGSEDGHLTAALRRNNHFCVHGIDVDPGNVARARHAVRTLGLHGPVSFDCFDGRRLPYADNLVNLIVMRDARHEIRDEELKRVLAPRGVIIAPEGTRIPRPASHIGNGFVMFKKPVPSDVDQWTHFLHGPDNNAVAQDRRVGAPRRLQWLADPAWMRNHHKLASISAIVSSAGRIFFVIDDATSADMRISGSWSLAARDACNGLLLWKREFPDWAWHGQGFRRGPVQLPRLLVAVEDRVYVPLGMDRPVSELDAATGRTMQTYDQTKGAEELIVKDEILYVVTGDPVSHLNSRVAGFWEILSALRVASHSN